MHTGILCVCMCAPSPIPWPTDPMPAGPRTVGRPYTRHLGRDTYLGTRDTSLCIRDTCLCTHARTQIHTLRVCICVCACVPRAASERACMHYRLLTLCSERACMHACVHTCVSIHTYIHTCMHAYIYSYDTHTQTHSSRRQALRRVERKALCSQVLLNAGHMQPKGLQHIDGRHLARRKGRLRPSSRVAPLFRVV